MIGSKISGLDEVVLDGETGLLVPVEDTDALAHALRTVIEDRDYTFKLGQAARERVATQFSWAHAAESYLTLLCKAADIEEPNIFDDGGPT